QERHDKSARRPGPRAFNRAPSGRAARGNGDGGEQRAAARRHVQGPAAVSGRRAGYVSWRRGTARAISRVHHTAHDRGTLSRSTISTLSDLSRLSRSGSDGGATRVSGTTTAESGNRSLNSRTTSSGFRPI